MNPRLKASRAAIEMIKRFEGFRRAAAQLPDGRWMIGFGHTKTARAGVDISEADAEALLLYDLIEVQAAINDAIFTPLTQNQFDALVAFAFNIGVDNFRKSSVLRRINEGNLVQAACAIEMWRKADLDGERLVVDALVRRRSAEKTLFLTPQGGWTPAPTPVVRPRVDYDVAAALPRTSTEAALGLVDGRLTALRADADVSADAPDTVAAEAAAARLKALNLAEADAGIDLGPPPPAPVEDSPPADATAPSSQPVEEEQKAADLSRRIVRREAPVQTQDEPHAEAASRLSNTQLMGLGALGLVLFTGSVFWGANAKGAGGVMDPTVVASAIGLVGVALVTGAVYLLLVKLGGRAD